MGLYTALVFWSLFVSLHSATALKGPCDQPAENCPSESRYPSGQDIGRIMYAHKYAADPNESCQRHGHDQKIGFEPQLRYKSAEQCAERQIDGRGQHRVSTRKRTALDNCQVRHDF